jgi:hypothetical protein
MTLRGSALYCFCVAAMIHSSAVRAGVWGMDPVLGVAGDYATNAALIDIPHTAESNGALLLDVPTTYNGNALEFSVIPSVRLSNSSGFSSVTSDYEHLNVKGEFDTERSVLTATAGVARDSSLYQDYLSDGTTGVQRNSLMADLKWDRFLTERIDFSTDVNSSRVRYGQAEGVATLTDYKYTSISPTFSWDSSERDKLTVAASVGRYNSLDGTTESRSANLQVGFVRQLSEIWSLTATGGYSRALNQLDTYEEFLVFDPGPAIEILPVKEESSQNGTVYSIDLSRKGTLLLLNAVASRQLIPTGFAFLSRQNSFELTANYSYSDRWSFIADARYLESQDPQLQGGIVNRSQKFISLSANWRWTEHWTATMGASLVSERFRQVDLGLSSNEITITLSRRFNHIKFQQ